MRWGVFSFLCLATIGVGCASKPQPTTQPAPVELPVTVSQDAASAALAFDPPIVADQPRFHLSRAEREPVAFVGYDDLITTSYVIKHDDRQLWWNPDGGFLRRRAVSVTAGVRYR